MDERDDNPFAVRPTGPPITGKAIRVVLVLIACSIGAYFLHGASQRWLISRLANDLQKHPPHVQLERLGMLAEFGSAGLPALLKAVVTDDQRLSASAFRIVSEMQGRWQTSDVASGPTGRAALVAEIEAVAMTCPPERYRRLAALLDPLILDTVESTAAADQQTYKRATQLLGQILRPSADSQMPRIARRGPTAPLSSQADAAFYGQDELPPLPTRLADAAADRGAADPLAPLPDFPQPQELADPAAMSAGAVPAHAAPFDAQSSPPPILAEVDHDSLAVKQMQGLDYVTDNPLSAYDTRSVVGFVASVQPHLRAAAEQELRSRGFGDGDLEMAVRLMSNDAKVRLAMVDDLATRGDVDPRRWLIWLASDAERDVRLEAIARLGTMDDARVQSALRTLLNEERDPTVATRLRRFLGLR